MKIRATKLFALAAAVTFATPVLALPDDPAEMRQIIASEFGGDARAYLEKNDGDFRVMGCRGRTDLIQALLDDGLDFDSLSYSTHWWAFRCAFDKKETEAMRLLITPDLVTSYEEEEFGTDYVAPWFSTAIYWDDYDRVRVWLENGVHASSHDDDNYASLTREEHLLLAAHKAVDDRKEDAIRAFQDAGFGYLIEAARNEQNVRYVEERVKPKGGGGGLLRGLATMAAGSALGGTQGAILQAMGGERALSGAGPNDDQATNGGPLPLPTGRADLGAQLDLARQPQGGLRILAIASEGPAQAAGLMVGDVITSIAGLPVNSRGSFYVSTEKAFDLETFEIAYRRGGTEKTLQFDPSASVLAAEEKMAPVAAGSDANVATGGGRDTEAMLAELERLADLHDRGILSDEEFETMKARILEGT